MQGKGIRLIHCWVCMFMVYPYNRLDTFPGCIPCLTIKIIFLCEGPISEALLSPLESCLGLPLPSWAPPAGGAAQPPPVDWWLYYKLWQESTRRAEQTWLWFTLLGMSLAPLCKKTKWPCLKTPHILCLHSKHSDVEETLTWQTAPTLKTRVNVKPKWKLEWPLKSCKTTTSCWKRWTAPKTKIRFFF